MNPSDIATDTPRQTQLAARIGLFGATMIVMGGIIGSGIFINSYVVARQVHTPVLILGAWVTGGVVAIFGAFIYAELAARLPKAGGQYAYLREAYHPAVAFLYGWVLLLVIQTGGMAAVAVTFAKYLRIMVDVPVSEGWIAGMTLGGLAAINCLGVRAGSAVQSALMVLKILAIAALVLIGIVAARTPTDVFSGPVFDRPLSVDLLTAFGAALTPVLFAYGGWQTANFVAAEVREPSRNLPRALILGVIGVILLYLAVNFVYLRVLGPAGLAANTTPATAVMERALGAAGGKLIALGIVVSTLGFLSQCVLTAPRVYYAMAQDGLFFRSVAWVDPKHRVPAVAILLQAAAAMVISLTRGYEQILNYVVSMDFIFFGLTATCVFVFRRREAMEKGAPPAYCAPGHPYTTIVFIAISWFVVANTIYKYPGNTLIGMSILLAGIPVYYAWRWRSAVRQ